MISWVSKARFIGDFMKTHKGTPNANLKAANAAWMNSEERAAAIAARRGTVFQGPPWNFGWAVWQQLCCVHCQTCFLATWRTLMIFLCFCKRVQEFATLLPEAKLGQCQPLRFDPALRKNNCCGVVHLLFLHWLGDFGMCLHFCNFCVCVCLSVCLVLLSLCVQDWQSMVINWQWTPQASGLSIFQSMQLFLFAMFDGFRSCWTSAW